MLTPGALEAAWARVLANDGASGGDRVTVAAFSVNVETRLDSLRRALAAGRYRPGPFRHVDIPKPHGGVRPLDIPCVADRVIQAAAAQILGPAIDRELAPESYAYRPGRGVAQAVAAVAAARRDGYRWTAEGDVERCFETIPHAPVLKALAAVCGDARLTDLVALWLEAFAPSGVGLPQGSPLSPLLCNLHLDAVDEAVAGHGVRLVRYADDFVLMTKSAAGAEAALERMTALLAKQGLKLNPDKTRIRDYDRSIRFLGHVFTRGMVWKEVFADETAAFVPIPREDQIVSAQAAGIDADATAAPAGRRAPRQRVLYMVEAGRRLEARGECFLVLEDEADRLLVHASRLDRIEVGPGAAASWEALALAAAHDVTVARVDHWGATHGLWSDARPPRARRLLAQAGALADPARKLTLARAFAAGRVANQRLLLKGWNRAARDAEVAAVCVRLERAAEEAAAAKDVEAARGWEGHGGTLYWPAYARRFDPALAFDGRRRRRPPPDPVNACISYLAALLERDLRVAAERRGLHPGLGALHEPSAVEAPSLVFDLMEAFRAPVIEALVGWLTSRRAVTAAMFVTAEGPDGEAVARLEPAARKALIRGYEGWVARPIQSRRTGRKILWRALFEEEAEALGAFFDTGAPFIPYAMDY